MTSISASCYFSGVLINPLAVSLSLHHVSETLSVLNLFTVDVVVI